MLQGGLRQNAVTYARSRQPNAYGTVVVARKVKSLASRRTIGLARATGWEAAETSVFGCRAAVAAEVGAIDVGAGWTA